MDYKLPKSVLEPPKLTGWDKELYDTVDRYLENGLEPVRLEALPWDRQSIDWFVKDLEYCIKNHINYYDLHPEYRETEDNFY